MIARLFPGRTRKMVKNKFTREEKYNEARVTRALTAKIPIGASPPSCGRFVCSARRR